MYTFVLFLHLLGVATIFIAMAFEFSCLIRAVSAPDVSSLRIALLNAPVIERLIPIAIVMLVGPGLYLLSQGGESGQEFSWGTGWIDVALGVVGVLLVIGPAINGARTKALHAAAEQARGETIDARIDAMRHDPLLHHAIWFSAFEAITLVFLMSNKPGLGQAVTVAVVAAVVSIVPATLSRRTKTRVLVPMQGASPATEAWTGSASIGGEVPQEL